MVDDAIAIPILGDSEIAVLEAFGVRRSVAAVEYLYREGDASYDFYVILVRVRRDRPAVRRRGAASSHHMAPAASWAS